MKRHELTDEEWELIADLMPASGPEGGHPWRDHRVMLNAMMWVLRTGAPWRDLPERFGPWQSAYDRFARFRKDGTLDKILRKLQLRLDREGRIDWDLWCVDGTNVRASRAAAGAGKKGAPTNPKTTRWVAREAGTGPRSTWSVTAEPFLSEST
jgi:transposase